MCEKLAGQVLRWAKEKVFWQPTHIPIFYMLHNARKMECGAIIKSQYRQTAERPNNILSVPYKLLLKVETYLPWARPCEKTGQKTVV